MSKGVLYKANGSAWSKSQAKKGNGSVMSATVVKHSNGSTWYDNYPMEQLYTDKFTATWSQGWIWNGTRLDDTAWYNRIIVGSSTGYRGMYGFKQSDIAAFIGNGVVQSARLHLNCYETTTNGAPDVQFGKHSYTSEPAGTWTGQNVDWTNYSSLHVPNKATGGYWVTLNPSQIRMSNGAALGGIALRAASNTDENMGKFSSYTDFTTELEITVLK
jgi:hypothetical protein